MAYSLKDITEHLRHSLPTVNLQSYQKFIHNHLQITKATKVEARNISGQLKKLLEKETGIQNLDFKYFDTYIVLIVYIFKKISSGTNDCKSFLHEYEKFCEGLRKNLEMDEIWSEILGTNHRPIVKELENYIVPEKKT